jgi:hypothetical protein
LREAHLLAGGDGRLLVLLLLLGGRLGGGVVVLVRGLLLGALLRVGHGRLLLRLLGARGGPPLEADLLLLLLLRLRVGPGLLLALLLRPLLLLLGGHLGLQLGHVVVGVRVHGVRVGVGAVPVGVLVHGHDPLLLLLLRVAAALDVRQLVVAAVLHHLDALVLLLVRVALLLAALALLVAREVARLQAEAELLLVAVHDLLQDHRDHLVAGAVERGDVVDVVVAELRDVHEAGDVAVEELDEGAVRLQPGNDAGHLVALVEVVEGELVGVADDARLPQVERDLAPADLVHLAGDEPAGGEARRGVRDERVGEVLELHAGLVAAAERDEAALLVGLRHEPLHDVVRGRRRGLGVGAAGDERGAQGDVDVSVGSRLHVAVHELPGLVLGAVGVLGVGGWGGKCGLLFIGARGSELARSSTKQAL